jgi:hypothetical protein
VSCGLRILFRKRVENEKRHRSNRRCTFQLTPASSSVSANVGQFNPGFGSPLSICTPGKSE